MSSKPGIMEIIKDFTAKFTDRIHTLESEKQELLDMYNSLNTRHDELKIAFAESENENKQLKEIISRNNEESNDEERTQIINFFNIR